MLVASAAAARDVATRVQTGRYFNDYSFDSSNVWGKLEQDKLPCILDILFDIVYLKRNYSTRLIINGVLWAVLMATFKLAPLLYLTVFLASICCYSAVIVLAVITGFRLELTVDIFRPDPSGRFYFVDAFIFSPIR